MRVHFVYVGGPNSTQQQAPYPLTRKVYRLLRDHGLDVVYYDWDHVGQVQPVATDDIVMGHPHYGDGTALKQLWQYECRAKILFHPLHHALPHHNLPFDGLARSADLILAIMGPYWYDTLDGSPFAHWKPKIVRLDTAIDVSLYPFLRTKFNSPGYRHCVFIGRDSAEKGIDVLYETMRLLPDTMLYWYGSMESTCPIRQLRNHAGEQWVEMTPDMACAIVNQADFLLSTSRSDANPTTLNEAMAWGLIPCATPESGYGRTPWFAELSVSDMRANASELVRLNSLPESRLLEWAQCNRKIVEREFSWEKFLTTVWSALSRFL